MMINAVIITNIPAPYSLDLFDSIQNNCSEIKLNVIFSAMSRKNRIWTINLKKIKNIYSLDSVIISKKAGEYIRYIHIPKGTWKTLNKINPEILLVYEYNITSIITLIWSKIHKRKYVSVTEGTLWSEHTIGKIQKLLRKIVIHNSDFFVACSSKSKEKLMAWKVDEEKIKTILLTLDIKKFILCRGKRKEREIKHILYVGSIEAGKGIDLIIHALKYTDDRVKLNIVGSGKPEYIDKIKHMAKEEGVFNKVKFLGFLEGDNLIKEYYKSDLFVFPTRSDCYGLVLIEAYCSGLPIVSSKYADGAYDVIENNVNGLIIDPYNAKEFGKAICEVISEKKYSLNAERMDTEKFEIRHEAEEFENVIFKMAGMTRGAKNEFRK